MLIQVIIKCYPLEEFQCSCLYQYVFSMGHRLTISSMSAGKLETDGTMHVTLCDFIESWEAMSATQKKSLTQRYESGCKCKVCVGVFNGNYRNITVHKFCSIFTQHIFLKSTLITLGNARELG